MHCVCGDDGLTLDLSVKRLKKEGSVSSGVRKELPSEKADRIFFWKDWSGFLSWFTISVISTSSFSWPVRSVAVGKKYSAWSLAVCSGYWLFLIFLHARTDFRAGFPNDGLQFRKPEERNHGTYQILFKVPALPKPEAQPVQYLFLVRTPGNDYEAIWTRPIHWSSCIVTFRQNEKIVSVIGSIHLVCFDECLHSLWHFYLPLAMRSKELAT